MTNKEAATWLREHFDVTPDGTKQSEAIDMAIKALEMLVNCEKVDEAWNVAKNEMFQYIAENRMDEGKVIIND